MNGIFKENKCINRINSGNDGGNYVSQGKFLRLEALPQRIDSRNNLIDAGKSGSRRENSRFDRIKQHIDTGNFRFIEKERPADGKITAPAEKNRESQG